MLSGAGIRDKKQGVTASSDVSAGSIDTATKSRSPYEDYIHASPLPLPLPPGVALVVGRTSGEGSDAGSNDAATVRASRRRLLGMLGAVCQELLDAPFYVIPSDWSSGIKTSNGIPRAQLEGALSRLGYRTSSTHGSALGVKTDAPAGAVAAVMRAWALRYPNAKAQADLAEAEAFAAEAGPGVEIGEGFGLSLAARIMRGLSGAQGRRANALRDAVTFDEDGTRSDGEREGEGGVGKGSTEPGAGAGAGAGAPSASVARRSRHAAGVKYLSNP